MIWQKSALRTRVSRRSFSGSRSQARSDLPNQLGSRSNETGMSDSHLAYLSLGSNIQPATNLVRGIELLQTYGRLERASSAWESESVGAEGPNYLNACVLLVTPLRQM